MIFMEADLIVLVKKPDGSTFEAALTIAQFMRNQAVVRADGAIVTIILDHHKNWNGRQQWIEIGRLALDTPNTSGGTNLRSNP